jgi:hypothetical protein
MTDGLYHKVFGFPKEIVIKPVFNLVLGYHAERRLYDLHIAEHMPKHFLPGVAEVIEIEVINGKVHKILARQSIGNNRDICYPFLLESKLVKTVWINMSDDTHVTLDKTRFVTPALVGNG